MKKPERVGSGSSTGHKFYGAEGGHAACLEIVKRLILLDDRQNFGNILAADMLF